MTLLRHLREAKSLLLERAPTYLILYVTNRCNARCGHCFYWQELNTPVQELSLAEIEQMAKAMGPLIQLSIGGGEPTLREDLPEVVSAFSRTCGVSYVTIPTNGIRSKQIASMAARTCAMAPQSHIRFSLSLDGLGATHDELRGVPGNFDHALETARRLQDLRRFVPNLSLDVATVMTRVNQHGLSRLIDFVHTELDVDNHTLMLARGHVPTKGLKAVDMDLYRSLSQRLSSLPRRRGNKPLAPWIRATMDHSRACIEQTQKEHRMVVPCVGEQQLLVIYETGEVHPCELLGQSMGNIRDPEFNYDLKKLLATRKARQIRKRIADRKCHCTFECAMNISVVADPFQWPKIAKQAVALGWHDSDKTPGSEPG